MTLTQVVISMVVENMIIVHSEVQRTRTRTGCCQLLVGSSVSPRPVPDYHRQSDDDTTHILTTRRLGVIAVILRRKLLTPYIADGLPS